MMIESVILHVISYFYFQSIGEENAHRQRAVSQTVHFVWGTLLSSLILASLKDFDIIFSLKLLLIASGLLMGYILYENKLKQFFNIFLADNLNSEHALYSVYIKNRSIIQFVLHQGVYLLWLILLNELVSISTQPLILAALSLVFFGIFIISFYALNQRDKRETLSFKSFLKHLGTYMFIWAAGVLFLQLLMDGLTLLKQLAFPISMFRIQSPYRILISISLVLLLLMKPTNLVIRAVSSKYDPKKDTTLSTQSDHGSGFKGAGAMIGDLERLLILLSFFFGSLLSVVAILSIKAFARYKLIAEDPYFSEYFVIGTMLSVLITFACYGLLVLFLV
ncbi:hypothetical protein [Alkalibacterium kapii]|uniref:DUF3307 domain-containing protein n=1 Tax=Alkalibacterium kapii TaxID=426704 RepID=A0A511AVN9_9LACT|nr:hypothetical protein [Alkalibacterium kapii]GEK91191.1 hypothetical protein AKA01nite_08130 [Alkalibacterium kapii]